MQKASIPFHWRLKEVEKANKGNLHKMHTTVKEKKRVVEPINKNMWWFLSSYGHEQVKPPVLNLLTYTWLNKSF